MKKLLNSAGIILLFVAIYNIAIRLVGMVATPIYQSQGWVEKGKKVVIDNSFTFSNVSLYIIAIALTFVAYIAIFKFRKQNIIRYCSLDRFNPKKAAIGACFGFSLNLIIMYLMITMRSGNSLENIYAEYTKSVASSNILLMLLSVAVLIPVFEEVIYRGLVFNELRTHMKIAYAVICQALIFVVLELIVSGANFFLVETIYGVLLSCVLALFYVWTGSLWTSIFARAFKNCASLIIVGLISERVFVQYGKVFVAIAAVVLVSSVVILCRGRNDGKVNSGADKKEFGKAGLSRLAKARS